MKKYLILIMAVLAALLVACVPVTQEQAMQKETAMMDKESIEQVNDMGKEMDEIAKDDSMMEKETMMPLTPEEPSMEKEDSMMSEPKLIAGTVSKFYEFDMSAMDKAIEDEKVVVLHFEANWCPLCKEWEPKLKETYNSLDLENVVAFKVHYKDDETTKEHEDVARKFGVASQGTTVVLKDGKQSFKSPAYVSGDDLKKAVV